MLLLETRFLSPILPNEAGLLEWGKDSSEGSCLPICSWNEPAVGVPPKTGKVQESAALPAN